MQRLHLCRSTSAAPLTVPIHMFCLLAAIWNWTFTQCLQIFPYLCIQIRTKNKLKSKNNNMLHKWCSIFWLVHSAIHSYFSIKLGRKIPQTTLYGFSAFRILSFIPQKNSIDDFLHSEFRNGIPENGIQKNIRYTIIPNLNPNLNPEPHSILF